MPNKNNNKTGNTENKKQKEEIQEKKENVEEVKAITTDKKTKVNKDESKPNDKKVKSNDEKETKTKETKTKETKPKDTKSKDTKDKDTKAKETKVKKPKLTDDKEKKVKTKKINKNENENENDEEDEITVNGKHIRSFKVKLPESEKYEGRFTGLTPYQAANKALSKFFRESNKPDVEITFSICESTRKSKKSTYTYVGRRLQLEVPVKYKIQDGREIVKNFKNSLKKVKKSSLVK